MSRLFDLDAVCNCNRLAVDLGIPGQEGLVSEQVEDYLCAAMDAIVREMAAFAAEEAGLVTASPSAAMGDARAGGYRPIRGEVSS